MSWTKNNFSGGMNMAVERSKIGDEQYYLLVNGRTRFNIVKPVLLPTQLTEGLPGSGTVQGIYGFDKYLIVFVGGYGYYKNIATDTKFVNIENFSMQGGSRIYVEAVPASTVNYGRKLANSSDNSAIYLHSRIGGTDVCLVCQDGINQPWKIYPDGTAKVTQTFNQWTKETSQEYVPIGTQMYYDSYLSKLYILAKDVNNRYTQILHSVSGRPLDFMVNIDTNGDKGVSEDVTGALSVAHSVSFTEVTSIAGLSSLEGAFCVGTLGASYLVVPDQSRLIFGEPRFNNMSLFPTGPTDNQAFADINGDVAFVDQIGIKSFNAVKQQANEGNSNPFSSVVAKLFEGIKQTYCAAINYDNYALFAIQSIYGPCVLVYDLNTKVFVGIDIYPDVAQILQFAIVKLEGYSYLYFRTSDNKVYQAFAGSTATCKFYAGDWSSPEQNQKVDKLSLVFSDVVESGTITTTVYADSLAGVSRSHSIVASGASTTLPQVVPYPVTTSNESAPLIFDFKNSIVCNKVGFWIEWNCNAGLNSIAASGNSDTSQIPLAQKKNMSYTL